jgi:transcriptional regulator with XRE-family HTH domain
MGNINQLIRNQWRKKYATLGEFAAACGVTYQTVQQWVAENGTAPSRKRQERVAQALGISVAELVAGALIEDSGKAVPHMTKDSRAAKLIECFGWLTEAEKVDILRDVCARAMGNQAIAKELAGRLDPTPDAKVAHHIKNGVKKKHR